MKKISLGLLLAGSLIFPLAHSGEEVAQVHHAVTSIQFSPSLSYGHLAISVTGEGISYEKQLEYGETVSFSASDVGLTSLPDGIYKYNLTASSEFDQEAWEASIDNVELENAFLAEEKANTFSQSGSFKIVMGQFKQMSAFDEADDN